MLRLSLLALLLAPAGAAQHAHSAADTVEVFVVSGLRVDPAAPPPGSAVGRAGLRFADGGYVGVVHGQPFARGRTVFGGLVGWDQVWSLGAHRATELWTTVPLRIGGVRLAPGGYSLLATPGATAWTLHVNRRLGAHLTDEYDAADDLVTVSVPVETLAAPVEALTLSFQGGTEGAALGLRVAWDRTAVVLPFERADR